MFIILKKSAKKFINLKTRFSHAESTTKKVVKKSLSNTIMVYPGPGLESQSKTMGWEASEGNGDKIPLHICKSPAPQLVSDLCYHFASACLRRDGMVAARKGNRIWNVPSPLDPPSPAVSLPPFCPSHPFLLTYLLWQAAGEHLRSFWSSCHCAQQQVTQQAVRAPFITDADQWKRHSGISQPDRIGPDRIGTSTQHIM